jgi:phosphocarrier protein HPr
LSSSVKECQMMVEQTLTLSHATGLHARPASVFVQTVQKYPGTDVFLRKGEREVNARSLLSVLSLGVGQGEAITIRCQGPQEHEALAALAALVAGGFGE